jgi:hypothetical protein
LCSTDGLFNLTNLGKHSSSALRRLVQ